MLLAWYEYSRLSYTCQKYNVASTIDSRSILKWTIRMSAIRMACASPVEAPEVSKLCTDSPQSALLPQFPIYRVSQSPREKSLGCDQRRRVIPEETFI